MKASQMREQTTEELQDKERDLAEQREKIRVLTELRRLADRHSAIQGWRL